MATERELLEEYVATGMLMQVATLTSHGTPVVCNVWYDYSFAPDVLRFISRPQRHHSDNIRRRPPVAGSIVAIALEGLGQVARAVTFSGNAHELPTVGFEAEASAFVARWPRAADAIDPVRLARDEATSRLYEIEVVEWVLFDEANFPDRPRRSMPGGTAAAG
jgi:Pyridoxamine 5'-phosphate oxidase